MHHPVDLELEVVGLRHQFERAVHIAERAGDVGSAAGNDVRLARRGTDLDGHLVHLGGHVAATGDDANPGAEQLVQEHVAGLAVIVFL